MSFAPAFRHRITMKAFSAKMFPLHGHGGDSRSRVPDNFSMKVDPHFHVSPAWRGRSLALHGVIRKVHATTDILADGEELRESRQYPVPVKAMGELVDVRAQLAEHHFLAFHFRRSMSGNI